MTFRAFLLACFAALLALALPGCLPSDTRPPPAVVLLDVQLPPDLPLSSLPDRPEAQAIVFQTDDGWTVTIEQLTASLGEPEVFADQVCSDYAGALYFRLLELTRPGPQRLAQIYGLNTCKVDYTVEVPPIDAVLGAGLSQDDLTIMNSAGVPVSSPDGPSSARGMALRIRGSATKDGVSISFDWGFADKLQWSECQRIVDGQPEAGLPLTSDGTFTVAITVDPRNLFFRDGMPLMQLVADADQLSGDANGVVAVSELTAVSVPGASSNLAEVLREVGYPAVFLYGDGAKCKLNDPEF